MTSRIQEDGGGTEAKWADIDDDEDDWAPETIEWTDGTKVTLTHTDHPPAPADQIPEESKDAAPVPEQTMARDPIKIAAPKPTTSVGPNPTVLRLGANAERQAKAASISSKGTNDRAPSGSTSPAPPPAKSPWAPLPPVERVSPVNPPVHGFQPPRGPGPVSHPSRDDVRQGPYPPQEIAADDFNRTWRESAPGAPRELYNSRSGRYEPVQDTRRGSWRQDQGPRPPAVLQRPNHVESGGPAEPSAAFQTHRSTHQDGMGWNRRRTSSNVSGGSGGFGRRMSFGRDAPPPRYMEGRRGSQTNGMVDPALMGLEPGPTHEHPPSQQHTAASTTASWAGQAPRSVSVASSVEQVTPAPVPEAPQEDPLVLQERIMKDARAQARQRRLEQEEKDRLEREERIKKKLAALGPPPEKPQPSRKQSTEAGKPQTPAPQPPATLYSPPKPPVPEPSGEPKQYGMMKVHHPDTVKKLVAANERDRASEKPTEKPSSPHLRRVQPSPREQKRELAPVLTTAKQLKTETPDEMGDDHDAAWRPVPTSNAPTSNVPNSYAPWTNANMPSNPPSVKNPWKLLNSDRSLGNGIFDQSLGGLPSHEVPLRGQLKLDQPSVPPQAFSGPQESASISPLPSPETRHAPIGHPGPIGPPSSQQNQWQQDFARAGGLPAWNNFDTLSREGGRAMQERARAQFEANKGKPNPIAASLQTNWKPLRGSSAETAQKKSVIGIAPGPVNNNNGPPTNPLTGLDAPADGLPFTESHARPIASVPARSSRFFPQASEQSKRPTTEKYEHKRSPSPPPPEEVSTHPVYFGDSGRPLVHLPNPKPVVKLPPKALAPPAAPAAPPTFASMAAAPARGPPAPASTAISWQEKFNGLFGKKTPVEKKSALAITSATKEPLDVSLSVPAVSVSLPSIENGVQIGDGHLAVRQVEEQEEIFEDREPGSLPSVRVPNMAPANAWQAAPAPPPSRLRAKVLKPMQVHSIEPYEVGLDDKDAAGNTLVVVRLPGAAEAKTLTLPKKGGGPPSRQQQPQQQRNSSNFNKPRKGPKPRDASGNTSGAKKSSTSSQQQSSSTASSSPRHPSRTASWGPRNQSGPRA